jgi:hypothetical protein
MAARKSQHPAGFFDSAAAMNIFSSVDDEISDPAIDVEAVAHELMTEIAISHKPGEGTAKGAEPSRSSNNVRVFEYARHKFDFQK